jgi:hypothetical protein
MQIQHLITVTVYDETGELSVELAPFEAQAALEAERAIKAQAKRERDAKKAAEKAAERARKDAEAEAKRLEQEAREELARLTDVAVKVADHAITRGRGGSYVEISEANARVHNATQRIRIARDFAAKNGLAVSPALGVTERRLLPLKAELGIR